MVTNMEEATLQTLEQIKAFLDGTIEVAFRVSNGERVLLTLWSVTANTTKPGMAC